MSDTSAPPVSLQEEWRAIPGYEGRYDVSTAGRVRTHMRPKDDGVLSQAPGSGGYPRVMLYGVIERKAHYVHRLVALAFLGPQPPSQEVRHLDGNRGNPALSNLAYGTTAENSVDSIVHGTHVQARKIHCPQGHPYDAANTYVAPSRPKQRFCRQCQADRKAKAGAWVA